MDGPKVQIENVDGTGTTLLEGLVYHEMNGTIDIQLNETGLVCRIEVPLTQAE